MTARSAARLAFVAGIFVFPAVVRGDVAGGLAWPGTVEPLAVGAAARRFGDLRVLAELGADAPPSRQLRAVEASPWLREPEGALPRLAALAGGRDPDVAPAAQAAALRIARALDAPTLEAREADRAAIESVRATFTAIATDEGARADIRRAALLVAAALP